MKKIIKKAIAISLISSVLIPIWSVGASPIETQIVNSSKANNIEQGLSIRVDDNIYEIKEKMGMSKRTDKYKNIIWETYRSDDYKDFLLLYSVDGLVDSIYIQRHNLYPALGINSNMNKNDIDKILTTYKFTEDNVKNTFLIDGQYFKFYYDSLDGNKIIGMSKSKDHEYIFEPEIFDKSIIQVYELQVFDLVNAFRAKNNLPILKSRKLLDLVARNHSSDMINNNYFSHIDPKGNQPYNRVEKAGLNYLSVAENIAYGYDSPVDVNSQWINSKSHRDNIISTKVEELGVGTSLKQDTIYWTELFFTELKID